MRVGRITGWRRAARWMRRRGGAGLAAAALAGALLGLPATGAVAGQLAAPAPGPATAAGPAQIKSPPWWNGTCDVKNDPGSYPLQASYNGVQACGPGPLQGGKDRLVRFFPGAWGEYEWECVELVMRYMYLAYGISPYSANGNTVVSHYAGGVLTKVSNNGSSLPAPGDIVSEAGTTSNPDGHAGVVTAVSVSGGKGTVTIMEQNASPTGWGTIAVSGGVLGSGVTGWLHHPGGGGVSAPALSVYSADQTAAGDQTNDIALAWTAATGGSGTIASYSVYRNGALIGTVPGTSLSYTDDHLPDGGMLNYQVSATDSAGQASALSNIVSLPYLPSGQSGLAWLGSSASAAINYCRRGGEGGSFATQYLECTSYNGTTWKTANSPAGIDWGYPTGRAWLLYNQHPTYCRRGGTGGSFSTQYLICTTYNGKTWKTTNSPAGIDWGYSAGADWVTLNGYPSYCRTTGAPPLSSQAVYCTTFNGTKWATANSGGGIDWGYPTGRGWVTTKTGVAYCRRGGEGGSFATQYLICTTYNGKTWKTTNSPAGIDWGYDPGADWVTLGGNPSYCRTTGAPPLSSQAVYCTTFNGTKWATANSGGGIDWGYPTGRGWVTTKTGVAYCRRGGEGGSFSTQYLICTTYNGTTWKTTNSPAGIDWGYDT